MGSCLSKKSSPCSITSAVATPPPPPDPISQPKLEEQKKIPQAEETIKKEIFVIKQRKSYEKHPHPHPEEKGNNTCPTNPKLEDSSSSAATVVVNSNSSVVVTATAAPVVVRTSSCTKEEVDAILIQCGRLSRSSSGKAAASAGGGGHKYSGSKRSYDFDNEYYYDASAENNNNNKKSCDDEEDDKYQQHHSRPSHRRTPSREKKDSDYKRSGSRDRSSSSSRDHQEERKRNNGGSRRSSRSPARSETLSATATATDKSRPGKMVSVPASVSTRDKNIESATTAIKRVSVKRSGEVVGLRTAASPRSKSPAANTRPSSNENSNHHQQVVSLSRNSSRKAEQSPYRRNPMSEIDDNCVQITLKSQDHHISTNKPQKIKEPIQGITKKPFQKPDEIKSRVEELPPNNNNNSQQETVVNCGATKQQQIVQEPIEAKVLPIKNSEITTVVAGTENLRPSQTITRSRSSRRSRDLDLTLGFNPDTLLNPTSYASLLLEDIHNFHQQNTATTTTTFSLPPCVTKACSILEAVADLNSCTSSNNLSSSAFSRDTNLEVGQSNKKNNNTASSSAHHLGKRRSDAKDPFVESEVFVSNDLLEPSLHKYVTLRRGVVMGGGETEQQESSGSNSYVGQHWVSPSSSLQDPNSADSTERWSSRSNTGEEVVGYMEEPSLIGCQKQVFTDASACDAEMGVRKVRSIGNITALPSVPLSGKKREVDPHRRVGDRGSVIIPFAAAASM